MWAEKHRPKCIKEIQGQELAFLKLNDFIKNFNTKRNTKTGKNAVLLYGPSGTGKNSLIYIVAKELDYDVIEFNASKLRDSKIIKGILKPATQQKSLFGKGSIIFIDEAEAFTWFDRGGLSAIISLIEETKWPLIFAANDLWDKKLNELRSKVEKIEFRKLDSTCITKVLQNICEKENLQISKEVLEKIALKSKGDARGAINDLQSLAFIEINDSVINTLGEREKDESIFQALSLIFKGKPQDSLAALENVNMPLDECFLWIDENLPLEYSGKELAQAYDALSKADIFRRRIIRRQHWRFLVYIHALATAGISAARSEEKKQYVAYKRLSRLLKIWMAKNKNMKKKELAKKLSKEMHCSFKKTYKEMPYFEMIFKNSDENSLTGLAKQLRLNEKESEYLVSFSNPKI